MPPALLHLVGLLEPHAGRFKLALHLTLYYDSLLFDDLDDLWLLLDHGYDFYVEREVGVEFTQVVLDVAFVQPGVIQIRVFELKFYVVDVFFDFFERYLYLRRFRNLFALAIPDYRGFGTGTNLVGVR